MLEEGKCYYTANFIVKILNNRTHYYVVKGFSIKNKMYHKYALMSHNVTPVLISNDIYDEIESLINVNQYSCNISDEIIDKINQILFEF